MDTKERLTWRITLRYGVVLGCIAALALASFLLLDELARRQEGAAAQVNVAGRQRMLSQRIALLAKNYAESRRDEERMHLRSGMLDAINLMEASHEGLIKGSPAMKLPGRPSPEVWNMYFQPPMELDSVLRTFIEHSRHLAVEDDPDRLAHNLHLLDVHLTSSWNLLPNLDSVVRRYQQEADDTVLNLKRGAQTILGLTLLILLLSAAGVFRPLVRQVRHEMQNQQNTERRLRGILDSALDAIVTIDAQGRIVEFSPSAQSLFGIEAEAAVGRDVADLIVPDRFRERHRRGLEEFQKSGTGRLLGRRVELHARRADGSEFPIELAVAAIQIEDQRLFTAFIRDVSAHRAAEDARRKLTRAVEQSPVSIMITDRGGRIEYVNPKFETVTGYGMAEIQGQTPAFLKSGDMPEDAYRELWKTVAAGGEWRGELHNRRKDGSLFWEFASISPVKDRAGEVTHYIAVKEDITERKAAEQALREAKEQAEYANRTKTEFLANMSHELRTPLNAIIGFSDLMSGQIFGPLGRPEYLEYAKDINDSGRHLLDLINDILDVSRLEIQELDLDDRPLDVADIGEFCLGLVRSRATNAGLALKLELAEPLPRINGDERRIKQVLLNLLTNAVKFTPEGGRITLSAGVEKDGWFAFRVADTGIGIAPEDIETALSTFGQVDGSLARKYEGAGLGLPLARRLTEAHGGRLLMESQVGLGTTVTVLLPPERVAEAYIPR
ncbi:MAG: PAS domain S-box protein [Magnetospirillum sp. WYHS-4]